MNISWKISAREREEAPRFYYKRTKARTACQRLKGALRAVAAFVFTQVGVVALIVAYTLVGAGIFGSLEADSQMEQSREAARIRARMAKVGYAVAAGCCGLLVSSLISCFEFSAIPAERRCL